MLHTNQKAVFQGSLPKPLKQDELNLSSKVKPESKVAFGGLWEKLFPAKVNKKVLDEYMSLVRNDAELQKQNTVAFLMPDKFQIVKILPQGKELSFELGFINHNNKFFKKAEAKVDVETAKLSYKSTDGLEYKAWEIESTLNYALKDAINRYKGY
jgi:hypothetical protein